MKACFYILLLAFLSVLHPVHGQQTLEQCQQLARKNYPLAQQYGLIEQARDYNLSNAGKAWLPQINLSGKASYQSDVTEIPISIPGISVPKLNKDQYQVALDINQNLWDGGVTRTRKSMFQSEAEVNTRNLDVTLYMLRDRVNQLFFGILLQDAQLQQNTLLQSELERNYQQINAYLKNGIANQADLDAVRAEQLSTSQQRTALEASRKAYCEMLSALTGVQVDSLVKPATITSSTEINRPELFLYDAQHKQLEVRHAQLQTKNRPSFSLFVQGFYGNPGLNMLKDEFSFNYVAGVRLSWNFGNLYTKRNENRLIENSRNNVQIQRNTFLFNTRLDQTQQNTEIDKLQKQMQTDNELITLRTNIRKAAEAKVSNGILSVTEMLREVTAEDQARQNKCLHEIQLLLAMYNLKYVTN